MLGVRALETADRQRQALELRRDGLTFDGIAHQLGLADRSMARKYVQAALDRTLREPAEEVRDLELRRLDHWLLRLSELIEQGDLKAIDRALKITELRARLLGLFAPVQVTGPGGEPLRFVVEVPPHAPSVDAWRREAQQVIEVVAEKEVPCLTLK
jgi:hypothetical protein